MSAEEPTQDPQDKAFGAAASRDQDIVDALDEKGVTEDELPDEPTRHPRAAGKAEPAGVPQAKVKRVRGRPRRIGREDPPA